MKKNEIYLIHGMDYVDMTVRLLEACHLGEDIGDKKKKIGLKPNLVVAKPASAGATTHPELVEGVIRYLQQHGFLNIKVMEGSWVGDHTSVAAKVSGIEDVCKRYNVPFVDLQKDNYQEYDAKGMKIKICNQAMEVDYMINMPVLKGHCQTGITCALKNNKGIIPNSEKRHFHTLGLHKPIAHLNTIIRNDFILVDNICGDLDFEEGGNPISMNRILGFKDPVLCDSFAANGQGYQVYDIDYIRIAEKLGIGSSKLEDAELIYVNRETYKSNSFPKTRRIEKLANYTAPKDACSACYGSLIYALNRLEEEGLLRVRKEPVCIGQGYKKAMGEIGIGQCTNCFKKTLAGCPPKAIDILEFLKTEWL